MKQHKRRIEKLHKNIKVNEPTEFEIVITHADGTEVGRVVMSKYRAAMGTEKWVQFSQGGVGIAQPIPGKMLNALL